MDSVHYFWEKTINIFYLLTPQDYLVLLPSAYYEAPIMQMKVTEPCSYSHTQDANQKSVAFFYLLYKHYLL